MKHFLYTMLFVLCGGISASAQQNPLILPDTVTAVTLPAIPMMGSVNPPAVYKKWWSDVVRCSQYPITIKDRNKVKFVYVNARAFGFSGWETSGPYIGFTMPWSDAIILSIDRLLDERVVKHEMLHYILWQNGKFGHPDAIFRVRCHVDVN